MFWLGYRDSNLNYLIQSQASRVQSVPSTYKDDSDVPVVKQPILLCSTEPCLRWLRPPPRRSMRCAIGTAQPGYLCWLRAVSAYDNGHGWAK